jgi:hypothetical protein
MKQNRPPKELDSALYPGTFIYPADYKLVVCKPCGFAVDARNFRHVDSMPHGGMECSKHQRRLLKQFIQLLDVISPEDAPPQPDGSPPIPELPIFNGFRCLVPGCTKGIFSTSREFIRMHLNKTHQLYHEKATQHFSQARAQGWLGRRKQTCQFWTVTGPARLPLQLPTTDPDLSGGSRFGFRWQNVSDRTKTCHTALANAVIANTRGHTQSGQQCTHVLLASHSVHTHFTQSSHSVHTFSLVRTYNATYRQCGQ